MTVKNRVSSRRVFRWECTEVELIPVAIEKSEYTERLARIAEELYPLMNQLHAISHGRSNSEIHPGETPGKDIALKPVAPATEHEGVCDGNESIQKAA